MLHSPAKSTLVSRFLRLSDEPPKNLLPLAVLSFGLLLCDTALPWLLKDIPALFLMKETVPSKSLWAIVAVGTARVLLGVVHGQCNGRYIARVLSTLNTKMAERCLDTTSSFLSKSASQIVGLYSEALFILEQFLDSVLWQSWIHLLYSIGAIIIVFYLGGPIVGFAFIPFGIALLLARVLRGKIEAALLHLQTQRGNIADGLGDLIEGRSVLFANQAQTQALLSFQAKEQDTYQIRTRALVLLNLYQPVFEGVALIAFVVIGLVGYHILEHSLDYSRSIASILYLAFLARSLLGLAPLLPMWDRVKIALSQLEALLVNPRPATKSPIPTSHRTVSSEIVLEKVTFGYEPNRNVFFNRTLRFQGSKTTAITGPNGAGKSTLLKLITGELQPSVGTIHGVSGQIAYLPQEPFLFRMSILENLRLISPDVTERDIYALTEALGLKNFLDRVPRGLNYEVGGRGCSLSGGERQKISLLRFVLRAQQCDLCLLDEPTSFIDLESEAALMTALLKFCAGKTTLLVSHRPWLTEKCDKILSLGDVPNAL